LADPIYKTIKKTASELKMIDDYGSEEVCKYAINSRTYLFEKILKKYEPPEITKLLTATHRGGGEGDDVLV
jgi:hypothetical protein